MITAGEPWVYNPFGREHLNFHPGNVYLNSEITPAVPTACGLDFSQDLLRALQGVTLQEPTQKEGWILRELSNEGEEELYHKGKIVVWCKANGYGLQTLYKSYCLENFVTQVLWCDFNLCCSKPRRLEPLSDTFEDESEKSKLSGLCVIQNRLMTVFTETGDDYLSTLPFEISRSWQTKFGLLFERSLDNMQLDKCENSPYIFSMLHPLEDVTPVMKYYSATSGIPRLSYFSNSYEEILFTSCNPSLIVTFNSNEGIHTIWKLRITTFEEADYACGSTLQDSQLNCKTPKSELNSIPQASSSSQSRFATHSHTPSATVSPFRSYVSSRISSPCYNQSTPASPDVSRLTHMATLSRSCSPSVNSVIPQKYSFTPLLGNSSQRSSCSMLDNLNSLEFMDPLVPDLCFDHQWTESQGSGYHKEAASKVFLSNDCTGHKFVCFLQKKRQQLKILKFEDSNDSMQWIFGTSIFVHALDAEPLPALDMIITLEINFTLTLYTGFIKVSKVLVSEVFSPFSDISGISKRNDKDIFQTPRRRSIVTSTRPTTPLNVKFGDEVLSPVSKADAGSDNKDFPFDDRLPHIGVFKGLKDSVANRVTVETTTGLYRVPLPKVSDSVAVTTCLRALQSVLPRDMYTQVFVKWYCVRNAPGPADMTSDAEMHAFLTSILNVIGYNTESIPLSGNSSMDLSTSELNKKQKLNDSGTDEDWQYLISSNFHNSMAYVNNSHCIGINLESSQMPQPIKSSGLINTSACVLPYAGHVLYALHLVYEDMKLNVMHRNNLSPLASCLFELARDLRLEKFMEHYWRDFPKQFASVSLRRLLSEEYAKKIVLPTYFSSPPCIYSWIINTFQFSEPDSFPYIPGVTNTLRNIVLSYLLLIEPGLSFQQAKTFLKKIIATGNRPKEEEDLPNRFLSSSMNPRVAAVMYLSKVGMSIEDVHTLPLGVSLALQDAILQCRHNPLSDWLESTYSLIGRQDLMSLHFTKKGKHQPIPNKAKHCNDMIKQILSKDGDDGFQFLDVEVLLLRFSKDLRICDVCHMLQSSKPIRISLQQRLEVSDHEFIEEQERHLYSLCIRTMSLPVGRGMLTLQSYTPLVTEMLSIPKLCLTGRAPPRNTTIDLAHIDVPQNMNMWPLFHNGVASGLRIAPNSSQIDSAWIVYNKPRNSSTDAPTEHAGFLMALGLNGHLPNLSTLSIHDYLCKNQELTSVGIILGISAAKRGTMDVNITKMLSIHIEALLPLHSTELDVPPVVQVASVMGIGLLYQGSANYHMALVMLGEIGRPPGPEMEHCVDRESYSLAAGLSLGLITFGKGNDVSGLTDLPMADQLYRYMVGGHKRPLTGVHKEKHKSPSYQIREGDCVNVDVTGPGATLALGMMFFDTNNQSVADWMTAPDTQFLLDMVRPDFLLLRTLCKGLILWSSVHPSRRWVESHVPQIVAKYAFKRGLVDADVDYETMSQAYCNIVAGCCLCLGLKFAGSASNEAYTTLMHYAKFFLSLSHKAAGDQAGRSTVETCLNVSVLSCAMVMAGTGDLEIVRICRHLRARISQASSYVLYGSHLATHMALGLVFLGGGRFTLSTSPLAIGCMLCAFYPKFPTHSNDNRYHLQALYHLYVLAAEPRLIIPRHLETHQAIYTHIEIIFKDCDDYQGQSYRLQLPGLLPELKFIKQIIIEDPRYWPIMFDCEKNWELLGNMLRNGGNLFLKQKAGCLPYTEDPQGFRSLLAQTYITNNVYGWNFKNVPISKFSSNPIALHFSAKFLQSVANNDVERIWQQKACTFLFECASQEKMNVLPTYISLIQLSQESNWQQDALNLWQVKLLEVYNKFMDIETSGVRLLRPEFASAVCKDVEFKLHAEAQANRGVVCHYLNKESSFSSALAEGLPPVLAAFLHFYQVPSERMENTPDSSESPDVPAIFPALASWKPSVPTVLTIYSSLSRAKHFV